MTSENIQEAIKEAKRFIKRAEALLTARKVDQKWADWDNPVQQGECRRASLDLTRTLARMRKP